MIIREHLFVTNNQMANIFRYKIMMFIVNAMDLKYLFLVIPDTQFAAGLIMIQLLNANLIFVEAVRMATKEIVIVK